MAEIASVGIGAGGAEHGATDEGERSGEAAATPRARRVVIHLVFVRLERDVVLVGVLGLLSVVLAAIRVVVGVVLALVVVVLALLVRPVLGLVIDAALGAPIRGLRGRGLGVIAARRIARPVARRIARLLGRAARRIAGGKLRFAHRGALPVLRRGRRRVMRVLLPLARIASPEIGEWIALPEQTGKLGQRIAGTCLLARPRRLSRATIWIIGAIGS